MTVLKDHQFEIVPEAEAMDGFVFGIGADVSLNEDGFDSGETSWHTQDGANTRRGVVGFGRDVPSPRTWTWESHTDQDDVDTAVDVLERFQDAWQPDSTRNPTWHAAIRYRLAGRDRRVFGRPRRFAAPPTNLILNGYVPITHDFQLVDTFTYDDIESVAQVLHTTGVTGGGFVFPALFPIQTQSSDGNSDEQEITIGGTARAYPRIRFNGPWVDPTFATEHWTLSWRGTVPASGWVEIDCRPWKLTVLNQDGASVVDGLDRRTWLEDCWFAPNSKPGVSLGGLASTGAASATVGWRNTFKSI